jgi:hypothetical protein
MLVLLTGGIYEVHTEMVSCGMTYIPRSFMKIITDIQAISRFCLGNLRGCNIGINDGRYS